MGLKVQAEVRHGKPGRGDGNGPGPVAPEQAERKRAAVELIRSHDTALRSTARRFSICTEDAEDAYQRGIEILLAKAPTTDVRHLLPWTRTVIKHEALAVRKARERILGRPVMASREAPEEDWVQLIPSEGDTTDELAAKRERVARSREALGTLKPQELKALTQLAEGFSYAEIANLNSWTHTKVNRCIAEGRQRFRAVFRDSEAGERCGYFEPLLSAACDSELDAGRMKALQDHLAACGHCRATLRAYRAAPKAAAALAPALPLSHSLWERFQEAVVSVQVRIGGLGSQADTQAGAIASAGGTRGMGTAALAKLLAVCVGTAGGAAACVATGVVPSPLVAERHSESAPAANVRTLPNASRPTRQLTAVPAQPHGSGNSATHQEAETPPDDDGDSTNTQRAATTASAPAPTPTESEFTPEAAGTPVPASAPPPPPAPAPSSPPVSSGGGEFAP